MRTRRLVRLVVTAVFAAVTTGCGPASEAGSPSDGALRLSSPPCEDEGDCVEVFEFDGRRYETRTTDLTDEDVAELEVERFVVAEPESIDGLVTTEDSDVIYLHNAVDERWMEGRALHD